ncbi:type IV secretion system protein VirB3 [Pseudomonas savastanoi]|uniref:type IV secretion system protein VirB3 n=1 Tax=Pseudomonas savastanoi TaxID=29438 RepID=UPI000E328125|nr:VirB3 family type IV secretion system protein [Pseudomonas savastanoi]
MSDGKFPLFKGATRLPTLGGIPRTVVLVIAMIAGGLWLNIHFYALPIAGVIWFVCWRITLKDDRIFRIIWLCWKTKIKNGIESPFKKKWGGSTYSPTNYEDEL